MQASGSAGSTGARAARFGLRCVGSALAIALLFGVSEARADEYEVSLRNGVAARDRARESDRQSDRRQALELFERAVAERDTTEARFELAEAAAELGQLALAYESYELCLQRGLSGKAAEVASTFMAAHERDVARLELVGPAGSSVYVNGERRAVLPLARPLVVPAGRVQLRLVSARSAPWEQSVFFDAQVVMRLAPELAQDAPPAQPEPRTEPGWLSRHPSAIVILSLAGASVVAGGVFSYMYDARDTDAENVREAIRAALDENDDQGVFATGALAACGPNGIAGGGVSFNPLIPQSDQEGLTADYARACAKLDEHSASALRYKNLAFISFGVAAVASAGVVAWYLSDSSDDSPPGADRGHARPRLIPIVTANTGALLFDLQF